MVEAYVKFTKRLMKKIKRTKKTWAIKFIKTLSNFSNTLLLVKLVGLELLRMVCIRWCWLEGVAGSAAGGRGREHAAEEGGQDLRPDGQEPRRPPDPGGVPGGQQGGSEDRAGAEPGGRRPRARRLGVKVEFREGSVCRRLCQAWLWCI